MRYRDSDKMKVILIRHAATRGNRLRRYIGVTDEDIESADCLRRDYPECDRVIASPMKRCIQTAKLIYPEKKLTICQKLRECDFGGFENKSYEDLKNDREYKKWLESGGKQPFPNGEAHEDFKRRSVEGFYETLQEGGSLAYVIHGGCIMAIMQAVFGGGFYDYQVGNGCGFEFDMRGGIADDYSAIGGA